MICFDCPRRCGAFRDEKTGEGYCRTGTLPHIARAALHMWEEPCISGTRGSGTVFFCGCSLGCVFCQNKDISRDGLTVGAEVTPERLARIYDELAAAGAHNINLVTPTHCLRAVRESLLLWDKKLPVVYNSGGYELPESLEMLRGLVDVFLPDMKYADAELAAQMSGARDYPETARAAIEKMFSLVGECAFDTDGMLTRGVMIRHLVLPGHVEQTLDVIDWVRDRFGTDGKVLFSLMSQYTPVGGGPDRRLTPEEYERVSSYLFYSGIEDGFMQELSSAREEYIPPFDLTGVNV